MPPESPLYGHNGFVSDVLCGDTGVFDVPPSLTLSFPGAHDIVIPGVTVIWSELYGEWATKYTVSAYHGERLVFFAEQENSETKSVLVGDIRDYDRVVISILEWSKPYHRARVESLFLGIENKFTKAELMSFSADMFVDPVSASLPKAEINFSIPNVNGEYNPDNPSGLSKYLMERQEVTVRYGFKLERLGRDRETVEDIEWIHGGKYFLREWDTPQNGISTALPTGRKPPGYPGGLYRKHSYTIRISRFLFKAALMPYLKWTKQKEF